MEYTPLRKFYAWVGFATLLGLAGYAVFSLAEWVLWAQAYVSVYQV
jgi:hypothetical protein